jgi:hypothetical protein
VRCVQKRCAPLVRLEGLAGEFSQHDFGHVDVRFIGGGQKRIHSSRRGCGSAFANLGAARDLRDVGAIVLFSYHEPAARDCAQLHHCLFPHTPRLRAGEAVSRCNRFAVVAWSIEQVSVRVKNQLKWE